jgi:hypothetical protein
MRTKSAPSNILWFKSRGWDSFFCYWSGHIIEIMAKWDGLFDILGVDNVSPTIGLLWSRNTRLLRLYPCWRGEQKGRETICTSKYLIYFYQYLLDNRLCWVIYIPTYNWHCSAQASRSYWFPIRSSAALRIYSINLSIFNFPRFLGHIHDLTTLARFLFARGASMLRVLQTRDSTATRLSQKPIK